MAEINRRPPSTLRQCALAVFAVSAWFALTLGLMMAWQHRNAEKTLSPARERLDALRARLSENSGDAAFRQNLRDLDALYRQAYFASAEQRDRGMRLLALATAAMFASAAARALFDAPVPSRPDPRRTEALPDNRWFFPAVAIALAAPLSISAFLFSRMPEGVSPSAAIPNAASSHPPSYASPEEMREQWTQFRGGPLALPALAAAEGAEWEIAWKVDVPLPGYGSPVVWGDRVFLGGGDRRTRALFAFSSRDGALLWRCDADPAARLPEVADDTGYAAPTPAVDGRRVYAAFATGQIAACDMTTGRRVWSRSLPFPQVPYGYASSPLLYGNCLVVQYFVENRKAVYALDAATGEILWEGGGVEPGDPENGPGHHVSWSSPIVAHDREGRPMVVVTGGKAVEAYDLRTGGKLWENPCLYGEVASSPAAAEDRGWVFYAVSLNRAAALELATGETVWTNEEVPLPDVASPLAAGDFVYVAASSGVVSALSLIDGTLAWEYETPGGFYASPVRMNERDVLLLDDRGNIAAVGPDAQGNLRRLSGFALGEMTVATPAVIPDGVIIRSEKNLFKLRLAAR